LENEEQELASDGNNIGIIMKPFEIKTIKI
jgi:hypothetical protein